jgi:hypothetical protein
VQLFAGGHSRKADGVDATLFFLTALITGLAISPLLFVFAKILIHARERADANAFVTTLGTPLFVGVLLVGGVLHIGLIGRRMTDGHREWWGRLGGWLGIYATSWMFLFGMALYSPYLVGQALGHRAKIGSLLVWAAATVSGVLYGKSDKTAGISISSSTKQKAIHYLARSTPYIFILGLLILLSVLDAEIASRLGGGTSDSMLHRENLKIASAVLGLPTRGGFSKWAVLACAGLFGIAAALAWRVDVNEFSVHYLYRNRLVRCYLGASVKNRKGQPFTGFSEKDEIPLADLKIAQGLPFPILNTTLNVVRGEELALQTRKARSFAFTPMHVGFTRPIPGKGDYEANYRLTSRLATGKPECPNGARLGTAMAISGAAVSPNMGYYSAPDLAFLMTIFDVRLGWWLANPSREPKYWKRGSPVFGFFRLLCELAGETDDNSRYVYLSDGGHFENLGMYELVRRRCKLIIACDASCDPGCGLGDLHNAMERCRVDFGVSITIDADQVAGITPAGSPGRAAAHYATGAIQYEPGNPEADGRLIYIKPALLKTDAADVLGYSLTNAAFPHDSTTDQWFDEGHFENYRALGEISGGAAIVEIRREIQRVLGSV